VTPWRHLWRHRWRFLRFRHCAVALWVCLLAPAWATTRLLLPGEDVAQAIAAAQDGDVLELVAGDYRGQVAVVRQKRLTLRGVGGRAVLHADGQHAEGKAILVLRHGDFEIENIEFRGARVPDANGAGIRFERGRLTVKRCAFFDNENGILTGNTADSELTVLDSDFGQAPLATKLPHLIYVGRIARFVLSGSRVSGGQQGHLVKSRARESDVRYNQLVDGDGGQAAYELEFPNGGQVTVVGNVIGQSETSSNPAIVSYGAEGMDGVNDQRQHSFSFVNNTVINWGLRPAHFVRVLEARLKEAVAQRLVNNLFVGLGVADVSWGDVGQGNTLAPAALLRDAATGDYGLPRTSWLRALGVSPGDLAPTAEFTPPVGTRALAHRNRWAPGAYQD
jgi:hypothetical protein